MTALAREVAVVGVGYSDLTRGDRPDPRALTLASCRSALDDAGLTPRDVDAIVQFTHASDSTEAPITAYMQRALGIDNLAYFADIAKTGPSGVGPPMTAMLAVASGVCDVALAYRTLPQVEEQRPAAREHHRDRRADPVHRRVRTRGRDPGQLRVEEAAAHG